MNMTTPQKPDTATLRSTVREAVLRAYNGDRDLFIHRAHERSIMFHIGRHLAASVDVWPDSWSVDLEYNRLHHEALQVIGSKYLHLLPGEDPDLVLPDLIIHRRSGSSQDHNLLVVEAKHYPSPRQRAFDYRKLRGFHNELSYQHAVFLEFPSEGPPRWAWISESPEADFRIPPPSMC